MKNNDKNRFDKEIRGDTHWGRTYIHERKGGMMFGIFSYTLHCHHKQKTCSETYDGSTTCDDTGASDSDSKYTCTKPVASNAGQYLLHGSFFVWLENLILLFFVKSWIWIRFNFLIFYFKFVLHLIDWFDWIIHIVTLIFVPCNIIETASLE